MADHYGRPLHYGLGGIWKLDWLRGRVTDAESEKMLGDRKAPAVGIENDFRESYEALRQLSEFNCVVNLRVRYLADEMASQWALASDDDIVGPILGFNSRHSASAFKPHGGLAALQQALWRARKRIVCSKAWHDRKLTHVLFVRARYHDVATACLAIEFVNHDMDVPLILRYAELKDCFGTDMARCVHQNYNRMKTSAHPSYSTFQTNVRFAAAGCRLADFCQFPSLLFAPDAPDPCKPLLTLAEHRRKSDEPLIVAIAERSPHVDEDLRTVCVELLRRDPHAFDALLQAGCVDRICRLAHDHAAAPLRSRIVDLVAVSVARGMDGRFGSESPLALLDSHLVKCILSIALLGFQRETE